MKKKHTEPEIKNEIELQRIELTKKNKQTNK